MRSHQTNEVIHKEVVVIGNGPSGIALSHMLSGNLPHVTSSVHPDEMLSARLNPTLNQCLVEQDLLHLSAGLEGRSTNPVSLLLDALLHPCADIGVEMDPLVEFRKTGIEIDHVVLGKGPPGGSWHTMDPYILTLSLGSWMALPGLPFNSRDSGEKRAFAYNVANYYVEYVKEMNLADYFRNNTVVTSVREVKANREQTPQQIENKTETWLEKVNGDGNERLDGCLIPPEEKEEEVQGSRCLFTNAINYILERASGRKSKPYRCHKRPREQNSCQDHSPIRKILEISENEILPQLIVPNNRPKNKSRSISFCCDSKDLCDTFYSRYFSEDSDRLVSYSLRNSTSLNFTHTQEVPLHSKPDSKFNCDHFDERVNWVVETCDAITGKRTVYTCKYIVLACGSSDKPNRLEVFKENRDPSWLFHDLKRLEVYLDEFVEENGDQNVDPVLIVGAGLSAADAVIAARGRNIPVIHVFRSKLVGLNKQLPENMYPEYHKVHQMMQDGSTYPLYTAYPEYTVSSIDEKAKLVTLTSKSGEQVKIQVSCAAVLIGSRPDLNFLPLSISELGVKKEMPIDCKTNPLDIDKSSHLVKGHSNLFAIGPLAGDNFVRFIPGGALAVVAELYKQYKI